MGLCSSSSIELKFEVSSGCILWFCVNKMLPITFRMQIDCNLILIKKIFQTIRTKKLLVCVCVCVFVCVYVYTTTKPDIRANLFKLRFINHLKAQ